MLEKLIETDKELFLYLNSLHNTWLDVVMYWVTDRFFWIPFYVGIIIFLILKFGKKVSLILLMVGILIFIADRVSSGIFKPFFERLRPCHELDIQHIVHLVRGCGGKYGFVSSHAANTFALVTFLWLLLRKRVKFIGWAFLWAFLVSYSRIYVGVHYPLDILVGAILGIFFAWLVYLLYLKLLSFPKR